MKFLFYHLSAVLFFFFFVFLLSASATRNLQEELWAVSIEETQDQQLVFSTGPGIGDRPNIKVEIFDKCRAESQERKALGELFPLSNIAGIQVNDDSGANNIMIAPGQQGNTLSFTFVKGIESNTDIYTSNNSDGEHTATITFCAQVGIYADQMLLNYEQVKLTYQVNLSVGFSSLNNAVDARASVADAAREEALGSPMLAYFCNAKTKTELTNDAGMVMTQGSLISICFTVPDGQFQVKEITDLIVEDVDGTSEQLVISDGNVLHATKTCTDDDTANICVLTLPLQAQFFGSSQLTLTGIGSGRLELGGAARRSLRGLKQQDETVPFTVKPVSFTVVGEDRASAAGGETSFSAASSPCSSTLSVLTAALVSATLLFCW